MASQRGLTVRGHERRGIELPVEFVIAEEHRTQVRFSTSSASNDQHTIIGTAFDLSSGGLGFTSSQFLPRHCEGVVRVMTHTPDKQARREHHGVVCMRFEHRVKVRRVWMNDNDGTYSIGLSFLNPSSNIESEINALMSEGAPEKDGHHGND